MASHSSREHLLPAIVRETRERSAASIVAQGALAFFYWASLWNFQNDKLHTLALYLLLNVFLVGRLLIVKFHRRFSDRRWVEVYGGASIACACTWGVMCWDAVSHSPTGSFNCALALMCLAGLCSSAIQSMALHRWLFLGMLLPLLMSASAIIWTTSNDTAASICGQAIIVSFGSFLFYIRAMGEKLWFLKSHRSEELELIFDSFPGGLALVRHGQFARVNSYIGRLLGKHPREVVRQPISNFSATSRLPEALGYFATGGSREFTGDLRLGAPGGPERIHWVLFHRLHTKDDLSIAIALDVQGQREIQKELEMQRAQTSASSKMAALGEMAGGLAHEINNPMAIISGHTQLIRQLLAEETLQRDRVSRSTEVIQKTIERVASIIRGLRNFARDSGNDPMIASTYRSIVEDTLVFCDARFRHHGVELDVQWGPIADQQIECRPAQISQILLNFLNNSFDAVQELDAKWIKIGFEQKDGCVLLTVTDSGRGIPVQNRTRLFEPFFTTKPVGQGTGLGLSISHGIATAHRGRLYFDHGHAHTRACLELPVPGLLSRVS